MAVGLKSLPPLAPVAGVRLGTAAAGVRYRDRSDLAVFEIAEGAHCAGAFTRNAFCAAPVIVAREHLESGPARYLLVNSGNANAGTGEQGLEDALQCCRALAGAVGCAPAAVLPFSTGVIGERLPVDRLRAGIPRALETLDAAGWEAAARAIMTTDTVPKGASRRFRCGEAEHTVTGVCKGAGMIRPDMATLLAFVATDAAVAPLALQLCLRDALARSFHRITVDGDTSTNDACLLIATGAGGGAAVEGAGGDDFEALRTAVTEVCTQLAQAVVRDAEGATRFIAIEVAGGGDEGECLQVAWTVAHSPLVKTAFFAGDPNWGRILAAVGRAGVAGLDVGRVHIHLDEVCIVEGGARAATYTEQDGRRVMSREEITVRVELGRGSHRAVVWTSDLSYDYVRINAEYRS